MPKQETAQAEQNVPKEDINVEKIIEENEMIVPEIPVPEIPLIVEDPSRLRELFF